MNDELLQKVEEYAGLFLTPEEIAIMLDIDQQRLKTQIRMKSGELYLAYMKGKTKSKMEIRKNVIQMAKNGSPQAEMLAGRFMNDQAVAETDL